MRETGRPRTRTNSPSHVIDLLKSGSSLETVCPLLKNLDAVPFLVLQVTHDVCPVGGFSAWLGLEYHAKMPPRLIMA